MTKILKYALYSKMVRSNNTLSNCSLFLFVLILFLSCEENEPIKVYEGDIVLSSQIDVDEFGSMGYGEINGNLSIRNTSAFPLTSLESLNDLMEIAGTLTIENCAELQDLNGFRSLRKVDGIQIWFNPGLTELIGFNNVEFVNNIIIRENENLRSIDAFNQIEMINGLDCSNNPKLQSLVGFSNLRVSNSGFGIRQNALSTYNIPPKLTALKGGLNISEDSTISGISGLGQLEELGGIYFYTLPELINVDDLTNINTTGDLVLSVLPKLNDLTSFKSISTLTGGLLILGGLDQLEDLDDLAPQITISNPEIPNLMGSLYIENNENLRSIDSFSIDCDRFSVIEITNNPQLLDLPKFSSSIQSSILEIGKLSPQFDFSLLSVVNGPVSELLIEDMDNVFNLDPLANIESVEKEFRVFGNRNLNDFCAFQGSKISPESNVYFVSGNGFNPTSEQLKSGICRD